MLDAVPTIKIADSPKGNNASYSGVYPSDSLTKGDVSHKANNLSGSEKTHQGHKNTLNAGGKKTSQGREYEGENVSIGEETRKTEILDGELTVKVYNTKGRLIRMIPPGYVPPNNAELDILA